MWQDLDLPFRFIIICGWAVIDQAEYGWLISVLSCISSERSGVLWTLLEFTGAGRLFCSALFKECTEHAGYITPFGLCLAWNSNWFIGMVEYFMLIFTQFKANFLLFYTSKELVEVDLLFLV